MVCLLLGAAAGARPEMGRSGHNASDTDSVVGAQPTTRSDAAGAGVARGTAVCVAGQLRSFLYAEVQRTMAAHLHKPGYEYLLALDQPIETRAPELLLGPIAGCDDQTDKPPPPGLGNCSAGTGTHFGLYRMGVRIAACEPLLVAAERGRGEAYEYVMRVRPDFRYLAPFPSAAALLGVGGAGGTRDIVMFDDQLAVAKREHVHTLFGNAELAYSTCADSTAWSAACGRAVRKGPRVPCCPFFLVLALGQNAGRAQPLRALRCALLGRSGCLGLRPCSAELVRHILPDGRPFSKALYTHCAPTVRNASHVVTNVTVLERSLLPPARCAAPIADGDSLNPRQSAR